jgi:DNA replication protein DnaC
MTTLSSVLRGLPGHSDTASEREVPAHRGAPLIRGGRIINKRGNMRTWAEADKYERDLQAFYAESLPPAECLTCNGGGRLRLGLPFGDPNFGKTMLCPDCAGSRTGNEQPERTKERLRIPLSCGAARVDNISPPERRQDALKYLAHWPPSQPILFLAGPSGAGKTYFASAVLWEAYERHGKRGSLWVVPELCERFRRTQDADNATETIEQVKAEMRRAAVLILDDLGTQRSTPFADEQLFGLIDERYRSRAPMVVTTNVDIGTLEPRLQSRLGDVRVGTTLRFGGGDRRMTA